MPDLDRIEVQIKAQISDFQRAMQTAGKEVVDFGQKGKQATAGVATFNEELRDTASAEDRYTEALKQAQAMQEQMTRAQLGAVRSLEMQGAALQMNAREFAQYQALRRAGTTADTEAGRTIAALAAAHHDLANRQKEVNNSTARMVAGMSMVGRANNEAITASQRMISGMSQAKVANDNFAGSQRLARHEVINLSRQIQDVGVSLASGQSPFMVLVQQGTQMADIFASSQGGLKGFIQQAKESLTSFLTPGRQIVLGFAAATAAAAGLYALLRTERPTAEQNLEEHARLVGLVKNAYSQATDAAGKFYAQGREQTIFQTIANIQRLRDNLRDLTTDMTKATTAPTSLGMPEMGIGPDPTAVAAQGRFREFSRAISELQHSIREGSPDFTTFNRQVSELGTTNPALQEMAARLLEISKGASEMSQKVALAEATLRLMQGTATEADRALLNLAGTINKVDMGKIREQNELALKALTAFSPAQKAQIAFEETRLRLQEQVNRRELTAAEQLEQAEMARRLTLEQSRVHQSEAMRERALASRQAVEAAQLEVTLVGRTAEEQARLRGELQIRHQLEQEASRNRTGFNDKEYEELKRNNAERAKADALAQKLQDTMQAIGRGFEQATSSFIGPFLNGLERGVSTIEAMRAGLEGVGNTMQSVGSRAISLQLGNLFSGQTVNIAPSENGLGLGGGAALTAIGTAISGIINLQERREQRRREFEESTARSQVEQQRRLDALRERRDLLGLDSNTLEGRLAAFDIRARSELSAAQPGGKGGKATNEGTLLEDILAKERLEIIKQFNEDAIAEEKRSAEERERIRQGFLDREFFALTDASTREGALAEFDRRAQREREEVAREAAETLPELERALAAERLAVERQFVDDMEDEARRLQDATNQIARSIAEYVQGLFVGPQSPLGFRDQLTAAQNTYNAQLPLAQAGNLDALGNITQLADAVLSAAGNVFASGPQYQAIFNQIVGQLSGLPVVAESTDPVVQAILDAKAATDALLNPLETTRDNTSDTASNIGGSDTTGMRKLISDLNALIGTSDATGLRKLVKDVGTFIGTSDTQGLRGLISIMDSVQDAMHFNTQTIAAQSGFLNAIVFNTGRHAVRIQTYLSGNTPDIAGDPSGQTGSPKPTFALGGILQPYQTGIFAEHHPRGPIEITAGAQPIPIYPGVPQGFAGNDNTAAEVRRLTQVVEVLLGRIADLEAQNVAATNANTADRRNQHVLNRQEGRMSVRKVKAP